MRTPKNKIKGMINRDCFYCRHDTGMQDRDASKCKECTDGSKWESWVKNMEESK